MTTSINNAAKNDMHNPYFGAIGQCVSESGIFYHIHGIVHAFVPRWYNIIRDGVDAPRGMSEQKVHYENAIKTLVVPEGVVGFIDGFMSAWAITELVVLPQTLKFIGTENGDSGTSGAFAGCYLPEVELPASIDCLGNYAFGGCYIKSLIVNPAITSDYRRQFKDSAIESLYLSKKTLEAFRSTYDDKYRFYGNFYAHCNCNIIEY